MAGLSAADLDRDITIQKAPYVTSESGEKTLDWDNADERRLRIAIRRAPRGRCLVADVSRPARSGARDVYRRLRRCAWRRARTHRVCADAIRRRFPSVVREHDGAAGEPDADRVGHGPQERQHDDVECTEDDAMVTLLICFFCSMFSATTVLLDWALPKARN